VGLLVFFIIIISSLRVPEKGTASIPSYWGFGLCPLSNFLKTTTFRKLDVFLSSGQRWETHALLGPLERANLSQWIFECLPLLTWGRKEMRFPKPLCSLQYWTLEEILKSVAPSAIHRLQNPLESLSKHTWGHFKPSVGNLLNKFS
jgi:hypothetical protein